MCGIAGIVASPAGPAPSNAQLTALEGALTHRGPDGGGHTVVGRVALVHTRLAIIDLSGGDQPLFAGSAALVGNGEIYNYRELYGTLPNTHFATGSDNELPLHLWLRDGPAYADHLRGMYAIAIHERVARSVTLSRDPFGIKPLYIAQTPECLAFASEPRALLAAGVRHPRGAAGGAQRIAANPVHHRVRDHLPRHPPHPARRDADLRRGPRAGTAADRGPAGGPAERSARMRRWSGWTAR